MLQSAELSDARSAPSHDIGDRSRSAWVLATRYPLVFATVVTGGIGLGMTVAGLPATVRWILGLYCAAIAAVELWKLVRQLFERTWGLDLLAVTAIVSTLLVGEFWASLVIVLMLTGGAALEDFAVERARQALAALLRQTPRSARRAVGGSFEEISVDDVVVGDVLQVRPGEAIPVDSTLLSAQVTVDESALTGESLPVSKSQGEKLLSGSVNGATVVEIRARAIAKESEFQKIVELVESASNSKAPFVRMADRFAVPFTALAYVIAVTAWVLSGDAVRFAEVLVVATPCPLLIAAPVAFIGGMDRAAKTGIIVRSGGAFELLARARTAAFDKTGTLTHGTPDVDRVEPVAPFDHDELLRLVAAVESQSGHVLANAIVSAARNRALPISNPTNLLEVAGKGISAIVDERSVAVGKSDFVAGSAMEHVVDELRAGEMAVYASVAGQPAGRIVLRDETRANARDSIMALRSLGIERTMMLTGDGAQTAAFVAEQVGIDDVHAALLPAEKVAAIATISPRPVLMVGDGVNDAPVLAAADIGIAMGARGSTAASETADVVILVDDLGKVVEVIHIARRTVTVAQQSLWVGIGLSVVLMVIAAVGVIPAIVGAALQEVVDVATILNGLRATRRGR